MTDSNFRWVLNHPNLGGLGCTFFFGKFLAFVPTYHDVLRSTYVPTDKIVSRLGGTFNIDIVISFPLTV